jgi:phosphohistidine swiveling domain-containing protein
VSTQVPLVMVLDDPAGVLETVGGKGASLARLARAGFLVPPGFDVTTGAYLDFVEHGGLREPMMAAMSGVDVTDPVTLEVASERISALFAGRAMPAATAAAIVRAYAALGDDVAVAVRSSATAEDLPGMSAAGQQDTYLNIRGADSVLDAVRRCWASLWTPRAIGYRARYGVVAGHAQMGVVVQQFVPADAAGVLFTVNPAGGGRDQVVLNASWGLGEAIVGGQVTPDVVAVDRAGGGVIDYQVGSKAVMTVPASTGTTEQDTPAAQRDTAVLTVGEASELAGVGLAIEDLYGQPVDVEWARAEGKLFVLQARPITGLTAAAGSGEQWNDSLDGDYLWSNGNLGEALPDVTTPATWSFIELFMPREISPPTLPGYKGWGRIGGRFYMNVSMSASLGRVAGISVRRFVRLSEPVFGTLPPAQEIPLIRLPRWRVFRLMVPVFATTMRRARMNYKRLPEFVAVAPGRFDELRAEIQRIDDASALPDAWLSQVQPFLLEASDMLAASGAVGARALLALPKRLAALIGEADAAILLSGQVAGGAQLASLGPLTGLAKLARGEIDRATFARLYGHRGAHEIEVSVPRPAEDAEWIDRELAAVQDTARSAEDLLATQETARRAVWDRLGQQPRKAAAARTMVARWAEAVRRREGARSELARAFWLLRVWLVRAGELTGHGDDLFFLSLPEILDVLHRDETPLSAVPGRKAAYQTYRALPPYPALIRGRFDPVRWAADPDRRADYYDERGTIAPADDTITGLAGASGVADGVARVISQVEDADQLGDGEILVTTVTNIGWTPIFPRAAAVVTDVGAPLSHAAIVARELGIPAVVGCGNATMQLHSGDRIRVDGGKGTVEVLYRA